MNHKSEAGMMMETHGRTFICGAPLPEYFWSRVDIKGPDDCWMWLMCTNGDAGPDGRGGYGVFTIRFRENGAIAKRSFYSHRTAFELSGGDYTRGRLVLHSCNERGCCNPAHLRSGTHEDNMRDAASAGTMRRMGVANGSSRVSPHDSVAICLLHAGGAQQRHIAECYGISSSSVGSICRGEKRAAETRAIRASIESIRTSR